MLKTSLMMLAAMVVVGGTGLKAQAATAPEATLGTGGGLTEPQETWQVAHVSQWGLYHQCNPSPCPKLKDRHKKGTGSVTE